MDNYYTYELGALADREAAKIQKWYVIPSCYYRWGDAVFGFILHSSNDNYSSFKQLIYLEMNYTIIWL